MLRDILRASLAGEGDVLIVGEVAGVEALERVIHAGQVDIVVLGLRSGERPDKAIDLLARHPSLRVLGVGAEGREAALYELCPRTVPISDVSPRGLVEAIRAAVEPHP